MDWLMDLLSTMYHYFTGAALWAWIGLTFTRIVFILIVSFLIKKIGNKIIDAIFKDRKHMPVRLTTHRREETLKNLLKNILAYMIAFIAITMILDVFDIPIKTMLAGAGVVGLAIGFGAQSLVRDVIAGFFIIFEDQFSVGDYIEAGEINGKMVEGDVEVIGMRSTKLRSFYGQEYVIANGDIPIVTNYSAHNGFAMVEISVPYEANIIKVEQMITDILETMPSDYDFFVDIPYIDGVQTLDLSNYVVRVRGETTPVMQWAGARAIRKEVKEGLFEKGVEIPSPRVAVYAKKDEALDENHEAAKGE